jgi:epoxyqueuosine reductase
LPVSEETIKRAAASTGISDIGVTTAEPLTYMRERLEKRAAENRLSPFETKDVELRLSPAALFDNCRSIITVAIPYNLPGNTAPTIAFEPKGLVARCARTLDYHAIVENQAKEFMEKLNQSARQKLVFRILTDRSPLLERELAYKSGLGFIGKNCTLISRKHGSYVALGTILVSRFIKPSDNPDNRSCGDCRLCIDNCPTGALIEPYTIDPYRCLSYLTQASGIFPRQFRTLLQNKIYGCDYCQEICPFNRSKDNAPGIAEYPNLFPAEPLLIPLISITRKDFDCTIGLTSAGWRGKTTIQRNAVIALGNSGSEVAIKPLARLLENDHRPVIRLHAAWALCHLGGEKARFYLEKSLINEPDREVREEVSISLEELI